MGIQRILKVAAGFETKIAVASYEAIRDVSSTAMDLVRNSKYLVDASEDKEGVQDTINIISSAARQLLVDAKTYGISAEGAATYKNYFYMLLAALGQRIPKSHYAFVKPLHYTLSAWDPVPVYPTKQPEEPVEETPEPPGVAYQPEKEKVELPPEAEEVVYSLMEELEPDVGGVGFPVEWKEF